LYGLSGVGKTQIAIEYSYRHSDYFDIVYWIRADDYNKFLSSYLQLYNEPSFKALMNLNLDDETDLEIIARQIKNWFENDQNVKWLFIIDNADNIESIDDPNQSSLETIKTVASLIPKGRIGCVLVTSRNRAANGQLANSGAELHVMGEENAKSLLLKCSQVSDESWWVYQRNRCFHCRISRVV
jgi:hypothetical protein